MQKVINLAVRRKNWQILTISRKKVPRKKKIYGDKNGKISAVSG